MMDGKLIVVGVERARKRKTANGPRAATRQLHCEFVHMVFGDQAPSVDPLASLQTLEACPLCQKVTTHQRWSRLSGFRPRSQVRWPCHMIIQRAAFEVGNHSYGPLEPISFIKTLPSLTFHRAGSLQRNMSPVTSLLLLPSHHQARTFVEMAAIPLRLGPGHIRPSLDGHDVFPITCPVLLDAPTALALPSYPVHSRLTNDSMLPSLVFPTMHAWTSTGCDYKVLARPCRPMDALIPSNALSRYQIICLRHVPS